MTKTSGPLVAILVYDGLCTFEFGCAFEVFGLTRPEMGPNWYRCVTVAAESGVLRAAGGLFVEASRSLPALMEADTIILPGWRGPDARAPAPLVQALRAANGAGKRIVAICGGAFVLAQAGLLEGRRATTHWHHLQKLADRYPGVGVDPQALYIDAGDILTSAGSAAGLDLCLHVVRLDFGAKVANSVARRLVISAHRDGGQAQFVERAIPLPAGTHVGGVMDRIRERLSDDWTVDRMAAVAHVSPRSLHRHFHKMTGMAPGEWLQHERLSAARDLLEETTLSVKAIAARVGLRSDVNFRQVFRQATGLTPTDYRNRFHTRETASTRLTIQG